MHSDDPTRDIGARFTLTGTDYEHYLRYFYAHTMTGRRHMRRLYAIGVAAFLLFVWREYDHPKFGIAHPAYFASYMIISGALLGGGYWYAVSRLWPSIAQAALRMSPQKGMFTETDIVIENEGMNVETHQGVGRLDWENVADVAETPDAIYLFMGGINAFIIPKRAFSSDADSALAFARVEAYLELEDENS